MRKFAFTLAETMIVTAIIGVLVAVAFQVQRQQEEKSYPMLYAKAYKTLNTGCFNLINDVEIHNEEQNYLAQDNGKSQADDADLKRFPNIKKTDDPTVGALCTNLAGADGYMNVVNASCNILSAPSSIPNNYTLEDVDPSFITSDNMRYYITNLGSGNTTDPFFMVFIDLNGKRKPNTMVFNGKNKPDIVPFLIHKDTGEIVPVGYPTLDVNFVYARVIYADPNMEQDFSRPLSVADAKSVAYGDNSYKLEPISQTYLSSSTTIADYFKNTYPSNYTADSDTSGVTTCDQGDYDTERDFPPCRVEINTHF